MILDELSYVPTGKLGAELLFDVISLAYERTSVIVTTNFPFKRWVDILGSERLTGAALDRLTQRRHRSRGDRHTTDLCRRLQLWCMPTTLVPLAMPPEPAAVHSASHGFRVLRRWARLRSASSIWPHSTLMKISRSTGSRILPTRS